MSSDASDAEELEESGYACDADGDLVDNVRRGRRGSSGQYQCVVCFKIFVSMKGLVQHSIIHTDRKPFTCEICGKAFRFKSNLFEHRSIHSGEQPFVCPFCGKACRLKGNLKKHLKTHCKEQSEIEQAYEAVTSAHNSTSQAGMSDDMPISGGQEYAEESYDYDSSPPNVPRSKRKTVSPTRVCRTAVSVLNKIMKDENKGPHSEGDHVYPPLVEMFDSSYSAEDFIRAARAVPFEKYYCTPCQLNFNCRFDMESHCENVHDLSRRLVNARDGKKQAQKPLHWCEICLREFEDRKSYDQHFFFHRRIRALINKGELHVHEPEIRTYF